VSSFDFSGCLGFTPFSRACLFCFSPLWACLTLYGFFVSDLLLMLRFDVVQDVGVGCRDAFV
ncbi:hypothetical protein LINPERHAP2_LOCUS41228, partial [Linum perenne]